MVPAAAPTFSTTMVWPRTSPIASACRRALASTPPPAANGTISVIGRVGQSCADTVELKVPSIAAAASTIRIAVIGDSISIQTNAARLDRLNPACELRFDEARQEFRRPPVLRGDDDTDRLEAFDHRRRVDGVARCLREFLHDFLR